MKPFRAECWSRVSGTFTSQVIIPYTGCINLLEKSCMYTVYTVYPIVLYNAKCNTKDWEQLLHCSTNWGSNNEECKCLQVSRQSVYVCNMCIDWVDIWMPPSESVYMKATFILSVHLFNKTDPRFKGAVRRGAQRGFFHYNNSFKDLSSQKWKICRIKMNRKRIPIRCRRSWAAAAESEVLVADYSRGSFSEFELSLRLKTKCTREEASTCPAAESFSSPEPPPKTLQTLQLTFLHLKLAVCLHYYKRINYPHYAKLHKHKCVY